MRSVVYAQIKNAIQNGFPEKAVSILKSQRNYLSKSELDKIFYLGMWNESTFGWFVNNIDEYRSYSDKHYTVMCNIACDRDDMFVRRGYIGKMLASFESFKKYGNKNALMKTLIDMISYLSSERKSLFLQRAIEGNCHKLIKRILKSARPGELDLRYMFKNAFFECFNLASRHIRENYGIYEEYWDGDCDSDDYDSDDCDSYDLPLRTIASKSYNSDNAVDEFFRNARIIYQHMNADEKRSCIIQLSSDIQHQQKQNNDFESYLLLKQKWIDYSGMNLGEIDNPTPDSVSVIMRNETATDEFWAETSFRWLFESARIAALDGHRMWRVGLGFTPKIINKYRTNMMRGNNDRHASLYSLQYYHCTKYSHNRTRIEKYIHKKMIANHFIRSIRLETPDSDIYMALWWACQNGCPDAVKSLLSLDGTTNMIINKNHGIRHACKCSGVNYAFQQNAIADIVDILMDCGADPSINKSEPLRWIAISGNMRIAKRLLDDDRTDVSAKNHEAVKIAYTNGHYWLCKELRQKLRSDIPDDLIKYYEPQIKITDSIECDVDDDSEYFDDYPDNRDSRLFSRPLRGIR